MRENVGVANLIFDRHVDGAPSGDEANWCYRPLRGALGKATSLWARDYRLDGRSALFFLGREAAARCRCAP